MRLFVILGLQHFDARNMFRAGGRSSNGHFKESMVHKSEEYPAEISQWKTHAEEYRIGGRATCYSKFLPGLPIIVEAAQR